MRIRILMIISCLVVAGCQIPREDPADDLPDLNHIELGEAAIAVSDSLDDLAAISAERAVVRIEPQTQDQLDYNLTQLASVDWTGPAEPLVQELAQAVNYHVRVIGKAPPNIVIVNLSKRNTPVGELLRDVTLQIQQHADLIIYPQSKLIEIHYHK
ncbi:MAG: DotD/TraH family lipoprotein [Gammaproteobacteria bacterium]